MPRTKRTARQAALDNPPDDLEILGRRIYHFSKMKPEHASFFVGFAEDLDALPKVSTLGINCITISRPFDVSEDFHEILMHVIRSDCAKLAKSENWRYTQRSLFFESVDSPGSGDNVGSRKYIIQYDHLTKDPPEFLANDRQRRIFMSYLEAFCDRYNEIKIFNSQVLHFDDEICDSLWGLNVSPGTKGHQKKMESLQTKLPGMLERYEAAVKAAIRVRENLLSEVPVKMQPEGITQINLD